MRTDAQRKSAYEARMLSTLLDPTGAAVVAKSVANFNAYVDEFVPMQLQMRAILNDAGISNFLFAGYEAYLGELYHLSLVTQGASLVVNATALEGKWASTARLGAGSAALLKSIALNIFAIIIP